MNELRKSSRDRLKGCDSLFKGDLCLYLYEIMGDAISFPNVPSLSKSSVSSGESARIVALNGDAEMTR